MLPEWLKQLTLYHYLGLSGAILVLLCVLLYFAKGLNLEVPAIIGSSIGCLMAGIAIGILSMIALGYEPKSARDTGTPAGNGGGQAMGGRGMGGGGGGGMGGMGMGGMGARQPQSKRQLAQLVVKLDLLTEKPLVVELKADQKKKIAEVLQGLGEPESISDDEAQKRLDSLLELLQANKAALVAAGYTWPGEGRARVGFAPDRPNPFKDDDNKKHLQSLQKRLGPAPQGT